MQSGPVVVRSELIPLYPGRPPVIKRGPEWFYVSVRDANFLSKMRAFRRTLAQAHPDRNKGETYQFRILCKKRDAFLKTETKWYHDLGLSVPGGTAPEIITKALPKHTGPRWHSKGNRTKRPNPNRLSSTERSRIWREKKRQEAMSC